MSCEQRNTVVSVMAPILIRKNDIRELTLEDWILAILAYAGGSIEDEIRLHAGLLLIKENTQDLIKAEFRPNGNGPYSDDVERALNNLVNEKLVNKVFMGEVKPRFIISLTEKGWERANESLNTIANSKEWSILENFFALITKGKLLALLGMVSTLYPEMYWKKKM